MLNVIWAAMIFTAIIFGFIHGRINEVAQAATTSAKLGFEVALGLTGIMALWLGMMNIAKEAGLIQLLAKAVKPILRRLFPEIPPEDPAMGAIVMNIVANMLGLGNAATPFGLQAMKELQRLNTNANLASHSMCMFLAINTSSVQLIPATAMALLVANGNPNPNNIIVSSLIATIASTMVAIVAAKQFAKFSYYHDGFHK